MTSVRPSHSRFEAAVLALVRALVLALALVLASVLALALALVPVLVLSLALVLVFHWEMKRSALLRHYHY